jgi:peptide/nickel transport system permease protein
VIGAGSTRAREAPVSQSPARLFRRQFARSPLALAGAAMLAVFYLLAGAAPFVAPYSQDDIDRARFYHPPHRLHLWDAAGRLRGLHVYATRLVDPTTFEYRERPDRIVPVRWLVHGARYRWLGVIASDRHLYGVDAPERIYLLGADPNGRDMVSRLLFGSQVSLTVGMVGIAISFTLGLVLGGISGYFGGWVDSLLMRLTELLLTIPGLYLIIALRAVFPADLPSERVYLAIVAILSLIGWAGLARVIRGMVLGIRRTDYVLAAEALGMSRRRIILRHILPNTASFVIVAATIAVPGYILGEVFLSFLGVGVQEPSASWGNMLVAARALGVLRSYPWLLYVPGTAIFLTVMAFNFLGDGLRDVLDPRHMQGGSVA